MNKVLAAMTIVAGCTAGAAAQTAANPQLDKILTEMDQASRQFHSATADFTSDQYTAVVDAHDNQSGKIYFKRSGQAVQMAMQLEKPAPRQIVYSNGVVRIYDKKINQLTEKSAGNSRADVESFLVLGFGGPGHELLKSYDVTLGGMENVNGVQTARLVLVPRAESVRRMFKEIDVWIDPQRDVSVQQKAIQPSGDYRLATYNNIKLNNQAKFSDSVFNIKTDKNTSVVK